MEFGFDGIIRTFAERFTQAINVELNAAGFALLFGDEKRAAFEAAFIHSFRGRFLLLLLCCFHIPKFYPTIICIGKWDAKNVSF